MTVEATAAPGSRNGGVGEYRAGPYPYADEANVFGELYVRFATRWDESKSLEPEERAAYCDPSYQACFWWAWPIIEGDDAFREQYEGYEEKTLTPGQMGAVLGFARAALSRANRYGYPELPVFDFTPEGV